VKRQLLQEAWLSYVGEVLPPDAPPVQVVETRRAFYAGARALQAAVFGALSGGPDATAEDINVMQSLQGELEGFNADVKAGRA
jgi:hypothetical protein